MQEAALSTLTAEQDAPTLSIVRDEQPQQLTEVALTDIYTGANYRKDMDKQELENLAESIRNSGQLQPAMVRLLAEPKEGKAYELVYGGRRYAAHELLQRLTLTCIVRYDMTDQQAEEARLIENVQRANPHPADEAFAIAALTQRGDSVEVIADRLGKSARWVAQRHALSQLPAKWLKALRQDKLTLGAAQELARWPEAVQLRLLPNLDHYGTVNEMAVQNWLRNEQRELSAAPWSLKDAELLPQAGACVTCPKRSSCATLLFDTPGKGKDNCLDSACWAKKLTLRTEQVIAEHSTTEEPIQRISSSYYQPAAGALPAGRYTVSKKKKGTKLALYVDGPQQGHTVRVEVIAPAKPEVSRGQQNKDSRRARLTKEARKRVLARRAVALLAQQDEAGAVARRALLTQMVSEQLLRVRSTIDDLMLKTLVQEWKWKADPTVKTHGDEYKRYVQEQINAVAPTEADLTRLLFFAVAHHDLSREWYDYQGTTLVTVLGETTLKEGLEEAVEQQIAAEYDPTTLRARK